MNETLADLYRQIGLRSAWQGTPEAQPGYTPPRPRPRQMRPLEQRLYDPNPGVVAQAGQQMRQQREMASLPQRAAGGYSGFADRNQVQEFGQSVAEMTGAPAWARGIQDVQQGRPGEAISEFLVGALNTAGIATLPLGGGARAAMTRQPMAPARPPMPQRLPAMAAPELPPQRPPVSERLDAGGARTGNWVDVYTGMRGDVNRPWRGHEWTVRDRATASAYGPNVRQMQGDVSGAPIIRTESDLRALLGDRADSLLRGNGDTWEYLDNPAVRDALRERGVSVVRVADDMVPDTPARDPRFHESYLFLDENRLRAQPDGGPPRPRPPPRRPQQ